jgi:hypothetical protein
MILTFEKEDEGLLSVLIQQSDTDIGVKETYDFRAGLVRIENPAGTIAPEGKTTRNLTELDPAKVSFWRRKLDMITRDEAAGIYTAKRSNSGQAAAGGPLAQAFNAMGGRRALAVVKRVAAILRRNHQQPSA